jgi:hypothetical protein
VKRTNAFTLLELLTVAAIIALLIGILIPVWAKVRQIGQRLKCASNLHQIGIALCTYSSEHDFYGPFLGLDPNTFVGFMPKTPEEMLSRYLADKWAVWKCPSDMNRLREVWYFLPDPNLPDERREISYTWSEPVLQGFYDDHPALDLLHQSPWTHVFYDEFKGAILADGKRMLNVWDWRKALDSSYDLNSLDQSHGGSRYHKVNLLFGDRRVEYIDCDGETLDELLPW